MVQPLEEMVGPFVLTHHSFAMLIHCLALLLLLSPHRTVVKVDQGCFEDLPRRSVEMDGQVNYF